MSTLSNLYFNSHDISCRQPFGAITPGKRITFNYFMDEAPDITVFLNYYREGGVEREVQTIVMERKTGKYSAVLQPDRTGLWFYWFSISINDQTYYYGNSHDALGGLAIPYASELALRPFQITVHNYVKPAPAWYKDAIFYQIFPDRFCNGSPEGTIKGSRPGAYYWGDWNDPPMYVKNTKGEIVRWDFAGGNLQGIIKKLPYLCELGIGGIYLNPIFKARSNHRYDTGDYHKIDPMLGTEADFRELCQKAEDCGIHIILDGVFNHTGADSIYFNYLNTYDSIGAHNSTESKYYDWYNFREYPNHYECWWGVTDLPNVNENSATYQNFIFNDKDGVVPYWLKRGAKGWRLDVADELPDQFIKGIRKAMDKVDDQDMVLIGEVWEDASNKIAYSQRREYLMGEELHGVMNYPFKDSIIKYLNGSIRAEDIYRNMMSLKENYPREAFYSLFNSLGTHDTKRIGTELEDLGLLKCAVGMLFTLPGVPCVYYGDEAGLKGERDPYNRAAYPWGLENKKIMKIYKDMITLRKSSKAFCNGEFYPLFAGDVFAYQRTFQDESYLVIINRNDAEREVTLSLNDGKKLFYKKVPPRSFTAEQLE